MTEEQYDILCDFCDRVLLSRDSTIERLSIQWLHVIREHPVFLKKYELLFQKISLKSKYKFRLISKLKNLVNIVFQIIGSLKYEGMIWFGLKGPVQNIDFLFISHLLDANQAGREDDFYFGNVPNKLSAKGYSCLIALSNNSSESGSKLIKKWKSTTVERVIFTNYLRLKDELSLVLRMRNQSSQLLKLNKFEKDGLFKDILNFAAIEAYSSSTIYTLRKAIQIQSLVAKYKPKVLILTHEGHAWERLAFSVARNNHPTVRCIGYQHAAIFKKQHALLRNLSSTYNPDQIFSAGQAGKRQLESSTKLQGIPIKILGSNRGFQNGYKKQKGQSKDGDAKITCLVLPEGLMSECQILFYFSKKCAIKYPEINFIWRLHPIVSWKKFITKYKDFQKLPSNIRLSHEPFESDINNSQWVLYRGTTAVIQAVIGGLKPLYLTLSGEMSINPLYEIDQYIAKIEVGRDFFDIISSNFDRNKGILNPDQKIVKKYCETFFSKFDEKQLENIL